jgi:hypothetical protein
LTAIRADIDDRHTRNSPEKGLVLHGCRDTEAQGFDVSQPSKQPHQLD